MDFIQEIIQSFTRQEFREFNYFLNRHKKPFQRKDAIFIEQLRSVKGEKTAFIEKNYGKRNRAYYKLRNRIYTQLNSFLLLQSINDDSLTESAQYLFISRFLIKKNNLKQAWRYLEKAEEKAINFNHFKLLELIYQNQFENSGSQFAQPFKKILSKKENNRIHLINEDKLITAKFLIEEYLHGTSLTGEKIEIKIIVAILKKHGIDKKILHHPELIIHSTHIAVDYLRAKDDIEQLRKFAIKQYTELEKKDLFRDNRKDQFYLLYAISMALCKSKKFAEGEKYLLKLIEQTGQNIHREHSKYFGYGIIMLSELFVTTKRVNQAIDILNKYINHPHISLYQHLLFNMNIAYYYFIQSNYRSCMRFLSKIYQKETFAIKYLDVEAWIEIQLTECIVHFHLENYDYLESRITSILKRNKSAFAKEKFQRQKNFLLLLRKLNNDPSHTSDIKLLQKAKTAIPFIPFETINLNIWLQSIATGKNYYSLYLSALKDE